MKISKFQMGLTLINVSLLVVILLIVSLLIFQTKNQPNTQNNTTDNNTTTQTHIQDQPTQPIAPIPTKITKFDNGAIEWVDESGISMTMGCKPGDKCRDPKGVPTLNWSEVTVTIREVDNDETRATVQAMWAVATSDATQ